jgi:hypothetical protein
MVYEPITETFIGDNFNEDATLQSMTQALQARIAVINAKNDATRELIDQINAKIEQITRLIPSINSLSPAELNAFKNQLRGYINSVESGADKEEELSNINRTLEDLLTQVQEKAGEVRGQGQGEGGGRRTKKHKKSKSKGKGKGKATKSKGRKTRRGRSGKAKKSRSRKHTSKRR